MNLGKKLGFAALLAMSTASVNATVLVLDDFDYGDENFNIQLSSAAAVSEPAFVIGDILDPINSINGGVKYDIHDSVGINTVATQITLGDDVIDTGSLAISMDGVTGITENIIVDMSYGAYAPDDTPLGIGVDFSGYDSFYFDIIESDLGFDVIITVFDGISSFIANYDSPSVDEADGPLRAYISFDEFAGANFANIVGVDISISATGNARDLVIGEFGVAIPEPTTVAIFGLALVGFAFNSRRKTK